MRTEERFIGSAEVSCGDRVIFTSAIYKLTVFWDGYAHGELRAPHGERLTPLVANGDGNWLQLRLDDGRLVVFQVRRADERPGRWGDIEGRVAQ